MFVHANETLISSAAFSRPSDKAIWRYLFFQRQRLLTGDDSYSKWLKNCGMSFVTEGQKQDALDVISRGIKEHFSEDVKKKLSWHGEMVAGLEPSLCPLHFRVYSAEPLYPVWYCLQDAQKKLNNVVL
jgi:hypothetical protein